MFMWMSCAVGVRLHHDTMQQNVNKNVRTGLSSIMEALGQIGYLIGYVLKHQSSLRVSLCSNYKNVPAHNVRLTICIKNKFGYKLIGEVVIFVSF